MKTLIDILGNVNFQYTVFRDLFAITFNGNRLTEEDFTVLESHPSFRHYDGKGYAIFESLPDEDFLYLKMIGYDALKGNIGLRLYHLTLIHEYIGGGDE